MLSLFLTVFAATAILGELQMAIVNATSDGETPFKFCKNRLLGLAPFQGVENYTSEGEKFARLLKKTHSLGVRENSDRGLKITLQMARFLKKDTLTD